MIDEVEYERRYYGRIYGKRRARVVDNQDPERRGRIKVENTELYGTTPSPWCLPNYPFYGGLDCGFFSVPPLGSLVWIECEEGLPEFPVYTGGFFDVSTIGHRSDGSEIEDSVEFQNEASPVPPHGRGDLDGSDFGGLKGRYGVPASTFEGEYGKVTILQTQAGHRIELDDTEGGERVQIHHKKGAHIEILPDGSINIVTEGKILTRSGLREEVVVNHRRTVVGDSDTLEVEGDQSKTINGTETKKVLGTSNYSTSGLSGDVSGSVVLNVGDLETESANNIQLSMGGDLGVITFGDVDINASGEGSFSFSNALVPPFIGVPIASVAGSITATNGILQLSSSDFSQTGRYGIEMRGGASGAVTGGHIYLGNLTLGLAEATRITTPVPLTKERAVLGEQLNIFLQAVITSLSAFYTTMQTGGQTYGYGAPNPILATASVTALASLESIRTTYLTPPSPLLLSDVVYLSKV